MPSPFGIGSFVATELALLFSVVVKGFGAEARIERERDDSIRAAEAGLRAGELVPALAELVAAVDELMPTGSLDISTLNRVAIVAGMRPEQLAAALSDDEDVDEREAIADALTRGELSPQLDAVIAAADRVGSVRVAERALVRAWTRLAAATVTAQFAAVAAFINPLTGKTPLPDPGSVIGRVVLAIAGGTAVASAVVLRRDERRLSRAIREGKDAGERAG